MRVTLAKSAAIRKALVYSKAVEASRPLVDCMQLPLAYVKRDGDWQLTLS